VALTTQLFAAPATTGKAEALQGAMQAVMNDAEHPYYAHPMFWAPFVVVGEGAR
jgi:CHAT domain-containing protein